MPFKLKLMVAVATASGLMTLAGTVALGRHDGLGSLWALAAFTAVLTLGWLYPLRVLRREETEAYQFDEAFFVAMAMLLPPLPIVLSFGFSALVSQLVRRRPVSRIAFNTGVQLTATGLALGVMHLAGGNRGVGLWSMVAVVGAAAVWLLVNSAFVWVAAGRPGGPVHLAIGGRQHRLPARAVDVDGGHRPPVRSGDVGLPLGGAAHRAAAGRPRSDAGRLAPGPPRAPATRRAPPRRRRGPRLRRVDRRRGGCPGFRPGAPGLPSVPPRRDSSRRRRAREPPPGQHLSRALARRLRPAGGRTVRVPRRHPAGGAGRGQRQRPPERQPGGAAQARGLPRRADRSPQPVAVRGDRRPGAGGAAPAGAQAGGLRARPRPVQAGQRQPGPSGGQRAAAGGRLAADRGGADGRHRGPHERRRVHHSGHRAALHRGGGVRGREGDGHLPGAVHDRRQGALRHRPAWGSPSPRTTGPGRRCC